MDALLGDSRPVNTNYRRGREFEYKRMKAWKAKKYAVMRTAGSHGKWDVICVRAGCPVLLIQCKLCKTVAEANRLIAKFAALADQYTPHYREMMEVWVSDTRALMVWNG